MVNSLDIGLENVFLYSQKTLSQCIPFLILSLLGLESLYFWLPCCYGGGSWLSVAVLMI